MRKCCAFRNFLCWDVKDYDGNKYQTVQIGSQEWLKTNLRVTTYADGSPIPNIVSNASWIADTTGAYCSLNNNKQDAFLNGYFYNYYAVNNGSGLAYITRKGVQQTGWRVPTIADWEVLQAYLGGTAVAGAKLKKTGTKYWNSSNVASNVSGFNAIGTGYRGTTGSFAFFKSYTAFHSSDIDTIGGTPLGLIYNQEYAFNWGYVSGDYEMLGRSVRLVRDIIGSEYPFRKGVRDGAFSVDKTLTATGFNGIEDTDWEEIKHSS